MRIAVNTRLLQKDNLEGIGRFTFETLRRIVINHPEVEFIFCFDRKFDPSFIFAENVKPLIIYPQARHPFLYFIWFQYRLPSILKKYKVDLILSPDGFIPLNSKIKTLSVIHDIAFEHFENGVDGLTQKYYKHYFPKFARDANRIATVSDFSKKDLVGAYGIEADKIDVVYNGVSPIFKPLNDSEKQSVLNRFGKGKPYFVCLSSIHPRKNILLLLKAFEAFKTLYPQFPHELIMVGRMAWQTSAIEKFLGTMNFKDQVIFVGKLNDQNLTEILASATAAIYPSLFEGFGLPVIEAFACGTPVITSKGTAMEEISKGAAYLFDPKSVDELVEQLYHQALGNPLNKEMVSLGLSVAKTYSWEKTAALLWQSIIKTIG